MKWTILCSILSTVSLTAHAVNTGDEPSSDSEESIPPTQLEEFPDELLVYLMSFPGAAKALRPTNKKFALLAKDPSSSLQVILKNQQDFEKYLLHLKNATTKEYYIPKIKMDYRVTREELTRLLETNPNITHLDITDCTNLRTSDIPSSIIHRALGITITNKQELTSFLKENTFSITKVKINLSSSWFNKEDLQNLVHSKHNITALDLADMDLTNESLKVIAENCLKLTLLNLRNNNISDLSVLKGLTELITLCVDGCKNITDTSLEHLPPELTALRVLDLSRCDNITDSGVQALCRNFPNLRAVNLNYCPQITSSSLQSLSTLEKLTELYLFECEKIKNDDLIYLSAPSLTTINLGGNPNITGKGIERLKTLPIATLYLWQDMLNPSNIGDTDLEKIAKNFPNLNRIELVACPNITASGLSSLHTLKGLRTLNLAMCNLENIDPQDLPSGITTLDLRGTHITDTSVSNLRKSFPHLNIIMDPSKQK